ncbi:MAG: putative dienelactone hydrolase [Spirosomataceae bacterium]|jgi:predicted dienelactone hydrolase
MKKINLILYVCLLSICTLSLLKAQTTENQFIYGDALPDAPELAARGDYKVGVRTVKFTNKNQPDILNASKGVAPLYDRELTVEIWYPAVLKDGEKALTNYDELMGTANDPKRPTIPFTFPGRAKRDAAPVTVNATNDKFPLVIVSHGYVGSRYLMTYLTENLASKGYIVAAIDHTESTFRDAGGFTSTLLNRSKDISFVINEMTNLGKNDMSLKGKMDSENIAIIGYSMGGYGVLNVAGAGYTEAFDKGFGQFTGGSKLLSPLVYGSPDYSGEVDSRIKAVVAFAPWGMERAAWDSTSLKGLKVPTFFIVGSQDDISGYEKGVKAIYEGAVNTERYLLTYENARHNVAPNPPPAESLQLGLPFDEYYRYAEPSWDQRRMNNINQHFVTAFVGMHLKKKDFGKYLDVQSDSNEKTWMGFKARSSTGLELLHEKASE